MSLRALTLGAFGAEIIVLSGCVSHDAPRYPVRADFGAMTESVPLEAPLRSGRTSLPILSRRPERMGPDSPITRRCREVLLRNEAVLELSTRSRSACERRAADAVRAVYSQCAFGAAGAVGAWATQLRSVTYTPRPGGCAVTGQWRLVGIDQHGAAAEEHERVGTPPTIVPASRALSFVFEADAVIESSDVALIPSDLDGDRRPEVVLVGEWRHVHETSVLVQREIEVRTALEDTISRYAPTADLPIIDAVDEDQDGLVDFVFEGPFGWSAPVRCDLAEEHSVLRMIAHSLPDGTHSTTDAVAQAYAQRQCPDPSGTPAPDAVGVRNAMDRDGLRVVCARLWGATPREALDPLRCRRFHMVHEWLCEDGEVSPMTFAPRECPSHFRRWAEMPPPLRLGGDRSFDGRNR